MVKQDKDGTGNPVLTSQTAQPQAGLLTPRAVAERAGFKSEVTILRLFRRGVLPGYKLGPRVVRFAETDVEAWLAAARLG
jgi:excisionase family DNA binding protein